MGVQFSRDGAQRIIHGIRTIEGFSPGVTAPPKNPRHPRRRATGGGSPVIEFEITDVGSVSESTSSTSGESSSSDSTLCDDRADDAPLSVTAKVIRRPCGLAVVPGEEGGEVTIFDSAAGEFLAERQAAELEGKKGFAVYLSNPDYVEPEASGSSSESVSVSDVPKCQWVITWINWFRWTTGVKDVIVGDGSIKIERHNFKTWDECDLEDEVIEGTDCEEDSSSGSSGAVV